MPPMVSGSLPSLDYAMGGVMRGSMSRGNDHSMLVFVKIAGVQYATARAVNAQKVLNETLSISEREGETPNTCSFEVKGFTPSDGQDVVITLGSINNLDRQFGGTILSDASGYTGIPTNSRDTVNVIDYGWQLTRRTISQRWTNVSATVIARAIIALCPGFTSIAVADGLPVLDEFTVTNQTLASALTALCQRVGGYWKATYLKDVRLGITTDTSQTDPTTLTPASALLTELNDFKLTRDLGSVITRQPVEGGGVNALAAVAPGETILPVQDAAWYNAAGGMVVSGPQRMTYAGIQAGASGSLVGSGALPSSAPLLTAMPGAGLGAGIYQYAYTDVTAAGESLPSPLGTVATAAGAMTAPTAGTSLLQVTGGSCTNNSWYGYAVSYTDGLGGETLATPIVSVGFSQFSWHAFRVGLPISTQGATGRKLYRTTAKATQALALAGPWFLCQTIADNTTATVDDGIADGSLGAGTPGSNTAVYATQQVALTGIAIGATGTTSRKVYRTVVGGSQLKLQQTIADNTTTTGVQDATADGSLGANVPTGDTSGLTQPDGQVNPGSATLRVASTVFAAATGGWAIVGNGTQVIRYTGFSAGSLTGIPASGLGALVAAVSYNTTITAAPALTGIPASGVGSILYAIKQGDPVNLRIVVDAFDAQTTIAALMGGTDDGIIEGTVIQDGRIAETEARARGTAALAQRSTIAVRSNYRTRDKNTHAGRTIGVNLAAPSLVGSLKLQAVTISGFHPSRWPTYQAEASSSRFTLEDFLRVARKAA